MGHNTCKSMGRVLCVVRRHVQLLLTYSQLGPRAIHFCAWDYVFTRIATDHVTTPTRAILAT